MDQHKHFFISYSHSDDVFALKFAADLKNIGINIWMDRFDGVDILPNDDWRKMIELNITDDKANALISIISPNYINSKYCMKEIARADRLKIPIIPILLDPISDDRWPLEIEREHYANFTNSGDVKAYQEELNKIERSIKRSFPRSISTTPDKETKYINSLIADLESRRGVKDYIELMFNVEESEVRVNIPSEDEWGYTVLKSEGTERSTTEHYVDSKSLVTDLKKFVLLGEPGAGKTTILRKLALDLARSRLKELKYTPLPIMIYLSQWDGDIAFIDFLDQNNPLIGNLSELVDSGHIFLFLDGLNEMGKNANKRIGEITAWVNIRTIDSRIIVSCREGDYAEPYLFNTLPLVTINNLNRDQIISFVNKHLGDKSDIFLSQVLPDDSSKEYKTESKKRGFRNILQNPYMLTALLIVYSDSADGELTRNTGKLFDKLVAALWRREEVKGLTNISLDEVKISLARFAFSMINSDMPTEVPLGYANFYISNNNILEDCINASLIVVNNNNVRFYHQLMQEYFAAIGLNVVGINHIDIENQNLNTEFNFLIKSRTANKWDQVIIALCGIVEEPLQILSNIVKNNPLLGVDCLLSVPEIDETSAIEFFIEGAYDENHHIRSSAIIALGKISNKDSINVLLNALNDQNSTVRKNAVDALAKFGDELLPQLKDQIDMSTGNRLDLLVDAISKINSILSRSTLKKLITSERRDKRISAIKRISILNDPGLNEAVVLLLDQKDVHLDEKMAIVDLLGNIQDRMAYQTLGELLEKGNLPIRIRAYDILKRNSQLTQSKKILAYTQLSIRVNSKKRNRAVNLIFDNFGLLGLILGIVKCYRGFWILTRKISKVTNIDNISTLLKIIDSYEEKSYDRGRYQLYAMFSEVVGNGGYKEYGKHIEKHLNSSSDFVVGLTINAISNIGYSPSIPVLINLLNNRNKIYSNSNELVCDRAAEALLLFNDSNANHHLKIWARSEIGGRITKNRFRVLDIIRKVGDSAFIPRLEEITQYKNSRIRSKSQAALEAIINRNN